MGVLNDLACDCHAANARWWHDPRHDVICTSSRHAAAKSLATQGYLSWIYPSLPLPGAVKATGKLSRFDFDIAVQGHYPSTRI